MATCPFLNDTSTGLQPCSVSCALKVDDKCAFVVIAEKLAKQDKPTIPFQK